MRGFKKLFVLVLFVMSTLFANQRENQGFLGRTYNFVKNTTSNVVEGTGSLLGLNQEKQEHQDLDFEDDAVVIEPDEFDLDFNGIDRDAPEVDESFLFVPHYNPLAELHIDNIATASESEFKTYFENVIKAIDYYYDDQEKLIELYSLVYQQYRFYHNHIGKGEIRVKSDLRLQNLKNLLKRIRDLMARLDDYAQKNRERISPPALRKRKVNFSPEVPVCEYTKASEIENPEDAVLKEIGNTQLNEDEYLDKKQKAKKMRLRGKGKEKYGYDFE